MARTPILAAGGIVVHPDPSPRIAVVQRRKDSVWVLPKGKLKANEKPVDGARREAMEETGHRVRVDEFLGVVSYEVGSGPKLVQFWCMEALGPAGPLMADIKAVEWLPLPQAIKRLQLPHEQVFLSHVGARAIGALKPPARPPANRPRPRVAAARPLPSDAVEPPPGDAHPAEIAAQMTADPTPQEAAAATAPAQPVRPGPLESWWRRLFG